MESQRGDSSLMSTNSDDFRLRLFGDSAVLLQFNQVIDEQLTARALAVANSWERNGFGSGIHTIANVLLRFDLRRTSASEALRSVRSIARAESSDKPLPQGSLVEIPVTYDGPDLHDVAARSGISTLDLIRLHSERTYRAYFVGFMPGHAYLGVVDPRIIAPRLANPRPRVPAGSVGVVSGQTAVYPSDSPGGWNLIARTATRIFDPDRKPPALIQAGDSVRFVAS